MLVCFTFSASVLIIQKAFAQEKPAPKAVKATPKPAKKKKAPAKPQGTPIELVGEVQHISDDASQIDFPAATTAPDGTTYIAYLEWNGTSDTLHLAKETQKGFKSIASLTDSGVLHAPALAVDGEGTIWCTWGQTNLDDDTVDLFARSWTPEGLGELQTIADTDASEAFPDAGTDSKGRVWITWQSFRAGEGDIYARHFTPESKAWSDELTVCAQEGGDWAPKLSFDDKGRAWVIYDSSRGNEFNLYLTRVSASGAASEFPIAHSERYEARASIAPTADGAGFWIASERGRIRWGLDVRGHGNDKGINAQKEILFGRFDLETLEFTEHPLGSAGEAGDPVNLPEVGVGSDGSPWVAYRFFDRILWRIAVTSFRAEDDSWTSRRRIEGSSYGQDRLARFLPPSSKKADIRICWPSDLRDSKAQKKSAIYLANLPAPATLPAADPPAEPKDLSGEPFAPSQTTPERPANDRHRWESKGKSYGLYWGDLHRHTDVSNCRTGFDGCIVEHFRYAYDIAKLDFLGTSDHTDIAKPYDPYEWWHNQRMHDALHSPGRFNTLFVYEREQKWPWGHRNIVFAQRGGPIVYINRALYRNSPWQKQFPIKAGLDEISPMELWDVLRRYGKPVASIGHTGATRMGTDWGKYDRIDYGSENIIEILQGARVSYEANGAPQPTVGMRPGEGYTVDGDATEVTPPEPINDFGEYSAGTFQSALEMGWKLGVFASSDHISQHASYGGVFCENFTREEIIEGFDARRTVAATDKIYLSFTCNGNPLGSIFETEEAPKLEIAVDGTAPLKRVTIIRNEEDWKVFESIEGNTFEATITDESVEAGENRYYVRVEQIDGNMAWSSPVWVTPLP